MKKFVRLGFVMLIAMAFVCMGCKHETENSEGTSASGIVELGMWPQTIKSSGVTVDETDSKTVGMFTYYKGSDGAWYVKQQEKAFRSGFKYSDGTDVAQSGANSYKYFKVEPIKWVVLTDDYSGKKLILSEKILIARRYDDNSNNYKNSEIRSWLNREFYNTAFTSKEQDRIADTNVDNSARSTNPDSNPNHWNGGANPYACENTSDKVFLLSEQEVTKSEYGFAEWNVFKGDSNGTTESTRIRMSTDFTKASGCDDIFNDWWLRSPLFDTLYTNCALTVKGNGGASNAGGSYVYHAKEGVVPALCLN